MWAQSAQCSGAIACASLHVHDAEAAPGNIIHALEACLQDDAPPLPLAPSGQQHMALPCIRGHVPAFDVCESLRRPAFLFSGADSDSLEAAPADGSSTANLQRRPAEAAPVVMLENMDNANVIGVQADNFGSAGTPPRKRLRGKTGPDSPAWTPSPLPLAPNVEQIGTVASWRVKRHAVQMFAAEWMRAGGSTASTYEERRAAGRLAFTQLESSERDQWIARARVVLEGAIDGQDDVQVVKGRPKAVLSVPSTVAALGPETRCVGMLYTWNGMWCANKCDVRGALSGEAAPPDIQCKRLAQCASVQELFDSFWTAIAEQCKRLGFLHCSCAAELSTNSNEAGRFHLHAFVSLPATHCGVRVAAAWSNFKFRGQCAPHCSPAIPGRGHNNRSRVVARGHFYLQAGKCGVMLQRSNHVKHQHFLVQSKWVMELWRQRKLSHSMCRNELLAARDKAHVFLAEVERVEQAEYEVTQKSLCDAFLADTAWARPWLPPTCEEVEWLSQFVGCEAAPHPSASPSATALALQSSACTLGDVTAMRGRRRCKVLVYDGPSRTGKSERARHWFGVQKTLVVQCQNVQHPCLRDWLSGSFVAILYEEANWRLMWENRMLMQSGPVPIRMGQSPTNQSSYTVNVFGVPMLLVTNDFWHACDDEEARTWLTANMCYRRITEPQWITH